MFFCVSFALSLTRLVRKMVSFLLPILLALSFFSFFIVLLRRRVGTFSGLFVLEEIFFFSKFAGLRSVVLYWVGCVI